MTSRVALASLVLGCLSAGPAAEAGNGSNYIHLINGVDYFFLGAPTAGNLQGIWRCFPARVLHGPTRVIDPANPEVGNYATKICAIHMTVNGSPGGPLLFPTISISTSDGSCHFTQSGGTALNFGLASSGAGLVVVGPLSNLNGTAATNLALQIVLVGASITNPATAPNILVQLALNLTQIVGSPSTIAVPDGDSMTLWLQENNNQTGPGNRMYWAGSLDERNICSGFSFLLSGNGTIGVGFNQAWEWSAGIGTLSATMTGMVTSVGGGPSSLNAHAGTAFAQPFDQGTGTMNVSISGTTPFPATSTLGEIIGFAAYDENNAFGGSGRLIVMNLWGINPTGQPFCDPDDPNVILLPSGGPGGPTLSPLGQQPRIVAKIDTLASTLLASPIWIAATLFTTAPGGSNVPWFPAGGPVSGSTGNTGGFAIPLPPLPQMVGTSLFFSSASLNATNTALAPLSNNGNSNSNGGLCTMQP